MDILDLIALFKTRSGDLNMTNIEINQYINRGIEFLDRLTEYSYAPAKYFGQVDAGQYKHNISTNARVIKEVWIIDSADGRSKLERVNLSDIREQYPDTPDTTRNKPQFYALDIVRAFPVNFSAGGLPAEFGPHIDFVATPSPFAYYTVKGIMFMPPADKTYVVEILGKFDSPVLDDILGLGELVNWWTENEPFLVIDAALYFLEVSYRNMEGAKGYLDNIKNVVKGLEYDKAEEDGESFDVMRG